MGIKKISLVLGALLFLLVITLPSSAQQIYKWKDEKGQWHFSQGQGRGAAPVVKVTVEKIDYRNRYVTVEGVLENISSFAIARPKIHVRAHDVENDLLLASDTVYIPTGAAGKIESQKSSAFRAFFSLPDRSRGREVKLDISVEDFPFEVNWQKEGKFRVW